MKDALKWLQEHVAFAPREHVGFRPCGVPGVWPDLGDTDEQTDRETKAAGEMAMCTGREEVQGEPRPFGGVGGASAAQAGIQLQRGRDGL